MLYAQSRNTGHRVIKLYRPPPPVIDYTVNFYGIAALWFNAEVTWYG
jgi:hypothetical protein